MCRPPSGATEATKRSAIHRAQPPRQWRKRGGCREKKDQITAEANAKATTSCVGSKFKKIVELEKIEVSREEVIHVVAMQAQQMGKDPQAYIKSWQRTIRSHTSKID